MRFAFDSLGKDSGRISNSEAKMAVILNEQSGKASTIRLLRTAGQHGAACFFTCPVRPFGKVLIKLIRVRVFDCLL